MAANQQNNYQNPRLRQLAIEIDELISTYRESLQEGYVHDDGSLRACRKAITAVSGCLFSDAQTTKSTPQSLLLGGNVFWSAVVAAIWLHLSTNNKRMALHRVWDCFRRVVTDQPTHTISEGLDFLLSQTTTASSFCLHFRTLLHVLRVLALVDNAFASQHAGSVQRLWIEHGQRDSLSTDEVRRENLFELVSLHRKALSGDEEAQRRRDEMLFKTPLPQATRVGALMRAIDCWNRQEAPEHVLEEAQKALSDSDPTHQVLLGCLLSLVPQRIRGALQAFEKGILQNRGNNHLLRVVLYNIGQCRMKLRQHQKAMAAFVQLSQTACHDRVSSVEVLLSAPSTVTVEETHWQCLRASAFANDAVVSLASATSLHTNYPSMESTIAYLFALLQAHQPSGVLAVCKTLETKPGRADILCRLYEAEAILQTAAGDGTSLSNIARTLRTLTKSALGMCCELEQDRMLLVTCYNNRGLAQLVEGSVQDAQENFRAAIALSTGKDDSLRPFFNLTLLLWRKGEVDEAILTWSRIRGFDKADYVSVKSLLDQSVSDYNYGSNSVVRSAADQGSVERIRGIDSVEVLALDCMILRCKLQQRRSEVVLEFLDAS